MLFVPTQLCLPPATHPPAQLCRACYVAKPLTDFRYRVDQQRYRTHCKACDADKARERRATADEAHREKERLRSDARSDYHKQWVSHRREGTDEAKPLSAQPHHHVACPIYYRTCRVTGQLFVTSRPYTKLSSEGKRIAKAQAHRARSEQAHKRKCPTYTCRVCQATFTPAYGQQTRVYCSDTCRKKQKQLNDQASKQRRIDAYLATIGWIK